jgi:hypothetical protein
MRQLTNEWRKDTKANETVMRKKRSGCAKCFWKKKEPGKTEAHQLWIVRHIRHFRGKKVGEEKGKGQREVVYSVTVACRMGQLIAIQYLIGRKLKEIEECKREPISQNFDKRKT